MTRKRSIGILAVTLLSGAGAWFFLFDSVGASSLTDIDPASMAQLKNDFNAASGRVRVIVLLSPT